MTLHEYVVLGVLDALYVLTERAATPALLAGRLGAELRDVEDALAHLERRGLVAGTRLTMGGLAAAASLHAARSRTQAA